MNVLVDIQVDSLLWFNGEITRETGPDIKPLICTTAFISKCKVLE